MLNTKSDFTECLKRIVCPTEKYYTPGCAGIKCGVVGANYGEKIGLMEGFSRMLWGLAPLWCGGGDIAPFGELCLRGIINGTDPESAEYWGEIADCDQKAVEIAAMGLALVLAPDKVWEPLDREQKSRFSRWLYSINSHTVCDNNWNFFPILVNLGLKAVGEPYDMEVIRHSLSRIHSFYKSGGWYSDGESEQMDYYIAFAMHFYGLIYARVMETDDPENSNLFKERAMLFAEDFIYWFADDGSALAFGRSLTYRFAQCCFWSACVFAEIEPFPIEVMKGLIVRNIEWWMEHPIFDNGGILSVGYAYPNITMSEFYNSFGSPYWALKSFLVLALPEDHRFFKAEAAPLPPLDRLRVIPEARMTIQHFGTSAVVLTAGQWSGWNPTHCPEKYSKFAYSTNYAFSVPRTPSSPGQASPDSMLAFEVDGMIYVRRKCTEHKLGDDGSVYSKWSPFRGITVESVIIPTENGHIRRHRVECEVECCAYDCGFAEPCDPRGSITGDGEYMVISCSPGTNLINPYTKMGVLRHELSRGITEIETTVIYPQ